LSSFTPEDVAKVLVAQGYSLTKDNQDEDIPVLQFRTRGVLTTVEFRDRVPDEHLFEAAFLSCVFPSVPGDAPRQLPLIDQSGPGDEAASVEVSTALSFTGGVTAEWLTGRVAAWTKMIVDYQQEVRRTRRKSRQDPTGVVH